MGQCTKQARHAFSSPGGPSFIVSVTWKSTGKKGKDNIIEQVLKRVSKWPRGAWKAAPLCRHHEVPFKPLRTHQHGYTGETVRTRDSQTLVRAGWVSTSSLLNMHTSCESSVPLLSKCVQEKWVLCSPRDMNQSVCRNTVHNPKPETANVCQRENGFPNPPPHCPQLVSVP